MSKNVLVISINHQELAGACLLSSIYNPADKIVYNQYLGKIGTIVTTIRSPILMHIIEFDNLFRIVVTTTDVVHTDRRTTMRDELPAYYLDSRNPVEAKNLTNKEKQLAERIFISIVAGKGTDFDPVTMWNAAINSVICGREVLL